MAQFEFYFILQGFGFLFGFGFLLMGSFCLVFFFLSEGHLLGYELVLATIQLF